MLFVTIPLSQRTRSPPVKDNLARNPRSYTPQPARKAASSDSRSPKRATVVAPRYSPHWLRPVPALEVLSHPYLYSIIATVLTFHPVEQQKQARKRIAVIPGDGIGKEVIPQAVKVIQATGATVDFTEFDWGADRYLRDEPPFRRMDSPCWPATLMPSWSVRSAIRGSRPISTPRKFFSACASRWTSTPTFARFACWMPRYARSRSRTERCGFCGYSRKH